MNYKLNLREVTYALSSALDLVGIDDTFHGKRVGYMAAEILKTLKYPQTKIDEIIYAGMLHDCGVSSTDIHNRLITELDWDNSQVHAVRGEKLLNTVEAYKRYATIIRYHHTHWNEIPETLLEEEKVLANVIYLVDRVDALHAQQKEENVHSFHVIRETIKKYKGSMFSPELTDIFLQISEGSTFWFYFDEEALDDYYTNWIKEGDDELVNFSSLKELAMMFAAVVDAKSKFTSEHSVSVSNLARYLAEQLKLPEESCEEVELAGLLHDLGKLRIDDAILNKPGKLNIDERLKMNKHGFDSYIILHKVEGFKKIAYLASLHHETLDSQGYPYHLQAKEIPIEARIIAVADIFQALIQDRPYRHTSTAKEALDILFEMRDQGKLDPKVVSIIENNLDTCYEKAKIEYQITQN
jgi:putative nucleotidyltransferase with HDIG domain